MACSYHGGGGGSLADKCATHPRPNTSEMDPKWRITAPYGTSNLHGVTPVKHNLNGVIRGVTYPKWRTLLYGTRYIQYPKCHFECMLLTLVGKYKKITLS